MSKRMESFKALIGTYQETLTKHANTIRTNEQAINDLYRQIDTLNAINEAEASAAAGVRIELTAVRALVRTLEDNETLARREAEDHEA